MGLIDDFQLHNLVAKQAERPAGVALGRLRTRRRNKPCFGLAIKERGGRWSSAFLRRKTASSLTFTHFSRTRPTVNDRWLHAITQRHGHVRMQRSTNILAQPAFTRITLIGLKKNAGFQVRLR